MNKTNTHPKKQDVKETMKIVENIIKKNPETLKLLNNGKKAIP